MRAPARQQFAVAATTGRATATVRRDVGNARLNGAQQVDRNRSRSKSAHRRLPDPKQIAEPVANLLQLPPVFPRPAQRVDRCLAAIDRTVRSNQRLTKPGFDITNEGGEVRRDLSGTRGNSQLTVRPPNHRFPRQLLRNQYPTDLNASVQKVI